MVGSTLRTALALVLPFAVLMPLVASDVANGLFGYGATDPGPVRADARALRPRPGASSPSTT